MNITEVKERLNAELPDGIVYILANDELISEQIPIVVKECKDNEYVFEIDDDTHSHTVKVQNLDKLISYLKDRLLTREQTIRDSKMIQERLVPFEATVSARGWLISEIVVAIQDLDLKLNYERYQYDLNLYRQRYHKLEEVAWENLVKIFTSQFIKLLQSSAISKQYYIDREYLQNDWNDNLVSLIIKIVNQQTELLSNR